jgi:ER-derived vesicles protein
MDSVGMNSGMGGMGGMSGMGMHPRSGHDNQPMSRNMAVGGGGGGGVGAGRGGATTGNGSGTKSAAVSALASARKLRKEIAPYLPTLVRLLLVATFVEDGVRVIFEISHQVDFLRHQYGMPSWFASLLLIANIAVSFVGVVLVVGQRKIARGALETQGSYLLLGCVFYQQALYGRHSPIGSGNMGFLVRNLCLAGSLILIGAQSRLASGQSALPLGLLDGVRAPDKKQAVSYMQLASRILLVLFALEFLTTLGRAFTILTIPVILAVLAGYHLEVSGSILLALYFFHNILNSAFWFVSGSYMREILRYEFVQGLSIMAGLCLLMSVGPGALSVDEMRGRKAF